MKTRCLLLMCLLASVGCGAADVETPADPADPAGDPTQAPAASPPVDPSTSSTPPTTPPTTPTPDPTPTPPPPPPTPGKARVRVISFDSGKPVPGIAVVFSTAAGELIETRTTDAMGSVERAVGTGEMATALVSLTSPDAVTWVGVKAGDDLVARHRVPESAPTTLTVNAQPSPSGSSINVTSAKTDDSLTGCSGGSASSTTFAMTVGPSCQLQVGGTVALLARTGTNSQTGPDAYYAKAAAAPMGGAVTLGPWQAGTRTTLTLANPPADETRFEIAMTGVLAPDAGGRSWGMRDGGSYHGTQLIHMMPPASLVDAIDYDAQVIRPIVGDVYQSRWIAMRGPAGAATYTLDGTKLLPLFSSVTVTAGAPGRPTLAWTSSAPMTVDGYTASFNFGTARWRFVVPPNTTSVTAPALPPTAGAAIPSGALTQPSVSGYEADFLPGYDAFRSLTDRYALFTHRTTRRVGLHVNGMLRRVYRGGN